MGWRMRIAWVVRRMPAELKSWSRRGSAKAPDVGKVARFVKKVREELEKSTGWAEKSIRSALKTADQTIAASCWVVSICSGVHL